MVTSQNRVTLRAQWLGRQLRELREASGLKLSEAGECLKRDASTVSRFETGVYPIHQPDVRALLDLFGVRDERRRGALLRLSEEAWRTGWWDGYAQDVEGSFIDYVWLESRATRIRTFDVASFYGLLQTPDYARAVIRGVERAASDTQTDRWVELRLMRQAILERMTPPQVSMIMDEALLWRASGGASVLRAQLQHLAALAHRSNIEIRVLPFKAGSHASPDGAFRVLSLPEPFVEVACVESPAGALYVEEPDAARFTAVYDQLEDASLNKRESINLINATAEKLE